MNLKGVSKRNANVFFDDVLTNSKAEEDAKALCVKYVSDLPHCKNLLFTGDCGTGKTMMASAMVNESARRYQTGAVRTVRQLVRQFEEARDFNSSDSESKALKWLVDLDLLVIDEVGVQKGTNNELMILEEIVDGRYGEMKPTVFLSNFSGGQMSEILGVRIVSRIKQDLTQVPFNWSSKR